MKLWKHRAFPADQCASCGPSSDEFGRTIAVWLSDGERTLSHEVVERLQAGRFRAMDNRKVAPQRAPPLRAWPTFVVSLGGSQRWIRIGSIAPLVVLIAGLALISNALDDRAVQLEAELDAQLLTDVLPPTAFVDAGFREFLRPTPQRALVHQNSLKSSPTTATGHDA